MTQAVLDLLREQAVEDHVGPAEYRAGRALADSGGVRSLDVDAAHVTADVDLELATEDPGLEIERARESAAAAGHGTAHVELRLRDGRLDWSCDCPTGRRKMPCEHVAATAIAARGRGVA